DDDGFGHASSGVVDVPREILVTATHAVAENWCVPINAAGDGAGIRIDQQFVRIEAHAFARRVLAVDAISIQLTRADTVEVRVPNVVRSLGQCDTSTLFASGVVEQTELDARSPP